MRSISDAIARAAFAIYTIFEKGGEDMMAMLFAQRVILGKIEFEQVPAKLKTQTADILVNECGVPELVPKEWGGTKEDQ